MTKHANISAHGFCRTGMFLSVVLFFAYSGILYAQTESGNTFIPQDLAEQPPRIPEPTHSPATGGGSGADDRIAIDRSRLPENAHRSLEMINVRDADLRDILRGIALQYDLNIVVDNAVQRRVTARLSNLPVIDAVVFLCEDNGLILEQNGNILRIRQPVEEPPPLPEINITISEDSLLSVDLSDVDLQRFVRALAEESRRNISVRRGLTGQVTGFLQNMPFDTGLYTLMENNGFRVRERDGVYAVDRGFLVEEGDAGHSSSFWINVRDGLVDLEVVEADVMQVIREIAAQVDMDLITYGMVDGRISARAGGLTIDQAMGYILQGTDFTFRNQGDVYFIGHREIESMTASRLVRLNHVKAEAVQNVIPQTMVQRASLQVVKEQNGLMVTGTHDVIFQIEQFVSEIDFPTPQIIIEALVVDFELSEFQETGISFSRGAVDSVARGHFFHFGSDGYQLEAGAVKANHYLDFWKDFLGVRTIGRLPPDFHMRIQALAREGRANIRSRPHIITLNGHPANISVGTTQYYILRSGTLGEGSSQLIPFQSERFEKVEAHVKLNITPWVSSSGEVTAEISPEFSTPVGRLDASIPPTINTRVLDATVRLKDGETIILGGLIQEGEVAEYNKVPILGDIPGFGRLFRNRSVTDTKSELVIYITPHIFYGDERDVERWGDLRESMNYSDVEGISFPGIIE